MSNTRVFTFGRMNPPSRGHIAHIVALKTFAERHNFEYCVYVSQTVDRQRNPITPVQKVAYLQKAFGGELNVGVAINMFGVLRDLAETDSYQRLIYFAGSDYFTDPNERSMFDRLIKEANKLGVALEVKTSGDRTPGISGSSLREAALNGDVETFISASPVGCGAITRDDAIEMFNLVRTQLSFPLLHIHKV